MDGNLPTAEKPRVSIEDLLQSPKVAQALAVVASEQCDPQRLLRLTLSAVRKTPKLGWCTPESLLGSLMTTGYLGLEPNTPEGLAYLIPYYRGYFNQKTKKPGRVLECQYQIGYRGFVNLAYRAPQVVMLKAEAVHQNDEFEQYDTSETDTGTFFKFRKALGHRGPLIAAFCFVRMTNERGHRADVVYTMPLEEIEKIRSRSETFRTLSANVEKENKGTKTYDYAMKKWQEQPWVLWEDEMAAKSAIKRLSKQLPLQGSHLSRAAHLDDMTGFLDMTKVGEIALKNPEKAKAMIAGATTADGDDLPEAEDLTSAEAGGDGEEGEGDDTPPLAGPGSAENVREEPKKTTAARAKPATATKPKPAAAAPKNEPPPPEDGDPGPGGPAGDDDELFKD